MKLYIIILKFLFVGMLFIVSNNNLHLTIPEERSLFFNYFFNWIGVLYEQVKEITGYVVKSEWLPPNVNASG